MVEKKKTTAAEKSSESKKSRTTKKKAPQRTQQQKLFQLLAEQENTLLKKSQERIEKKDYYVRKELVLEREKTNYDMIIIFRGNQGHWWKMVGHSLIIYRHMVSKRLKKRNLNVMPDTDFALRAPGGVISIPYADDFEKRMARLGLKPDENNNNDYKAFHLHEVLTEEILNVWCNEERMKWEVAEKLIYPANLWVGLREAILELQREIVPAVSRIYESKIQSYKKDMADRFPAILCRMSKSFYNAMGTPSNATEQLLNILDALNELRGLMMLMTSIQVVDADRVARIGESITKVHEQIDKELKVELRKERKAAQVYAAKSSEEKDVSKSSETK